MHHVVAGAVVVALLGSGVLAGCEKGPAQKAGEKLDDAAHALTRTGPVETTGERIDSIVDNLPTR